MRLRTNTSLNSSVSSRRLSESALLCSQKVTAQSRHVSSTCASGSSPELCMLASMDVRTGMRKLRRDSEQNEMKREDCSVDKYLSGDNSARRQVRTRHVRLPCVDLGEHSRKLGGAAYLRHQVHSLCATCKSTTDTRYGNCYSFGTKRSCVAPSWAIPCQAPAVVAVTCAHLRPCSG